MITTAILLFAAIVFLAVAAYAAGRADGWNAGVADTRRMYREETARMNLERNKQIIDQVAKGKA